MVNMCMSGQSETTVMIPRSMLSLPRQATEKYSEMEYLSMYRADVPQPLLQNRIQMLQVLYCCFAQASTSNNFLPWINSKCHKSGAVTMYIFSSTRHTVFTCICSLFCYSETVFITVCSSSLYSFLFVILRWDSQKAPPPYSHTLGSQVTNNLENT